MYALFQQLWFLLTCVDAFFECVENGGSYVSYRRPRSHVWDTSPFYKKLHLLLRIELEVDKCETFWVLIWIIPPIKFNCQFKLTRIKTLKLKDIRNYMCLMRYRGYTILTQYSTPTPVRN